MRCENISAPVQDKDIDSKSMWLSWLGKCPFILVYLIYQFAIRDEPSAQTHFVTETKLFPPKVDQSYASLPYHEWKKMNRSISD